MYAYIFQSKKSYDPRKGVLTQGRPIRPIWDTRDYESLYIRVMARGRHKNRTCISLKSRDWRRLTPPFKWGPMERGICARDPLLKNRFGHLSRSRDCHPQCNAFVICFWSLYIHTWKYGHNIITTSICGQKVYIYQPMHLIQTPLRALICNLSFSFLLLVPYIH